MSATSAPNRRREIDDRCHVICPVSSLLCHLGVTQRSHLHRGSHCRDPSTSTHLVSRNSLRAAVVELGRLADDDGPGAQVRMLCRSVRLGIDRWLRACACASARPSAGSRRAGAGLSDRLSVRAGYRMRVDGRKGSGPPWNRCPSYRSMNVPAQDRSSAREPARSATYVNLW
jgi:hypothetical protein